MFFTIMAYLVVGNVIPDSPNFTRTKVICSDILYFHETEGRKYAGFYTKSNKNYLTMHESSDTLSKYVKETCKN